MSFGRLITFPIFIPLYIYIYIYKRKILDTRGCLDFVFFITHYSKFVGPTHATLVWICFQFLFPSLKTHQNKLWMSENENKKSKQSDDGIFVNIFIWWAPFLCLVVSLPVPMTTNGSLLYQTISFLSFFFLFFLFLFSSQATLLSPYPLAINTTHYSRSFGLPLQLKLKSSFRSVSISVSTVGLVVSDCGLSSWRHRRGSRLGIYGFIFVCLREFVSVVFGLWLRGGKIWNLEWEREKIWAMGKHKNK